MALSDGKLRRCGLAFAVACSLWAAAAGAVGQSTQIPITDGTAAGSSERPLGASGLKLPRFAALRADEVNLRAGPGTRYPIEWVYKRRNLPVEIIDEFDTWRRIRDWEGTEGWVHQSMLHGRRSILIVDDLAMLRRDPQDDSRGVARLEAGVVGRVDSCGDVWCVIIAANRKGWLRRDQFYGMYRDEQIQ